MKCQGMDRQPSGRKGVAAAAKRIGAILAFLGGLSAGDVLANILRVPDDYSTIQAAVDAAVSGDVIRVGPGAYPERVTISKSAIRLEADPVHAAVLDGGTFAVAGAAISVQGTSESHVRDVSVVGFRIENQWGPGINLLFADRCEILSNKVNNTGAQSIVLARSTFTVIAGNTLSNGTIGVAMSMRSSDNTVKENMIFGVFTNGIRVSMVDNTPLRNTIKENVICVQDARSLTGVTIAGSASWNAVKENKIVGNGSSTVGIKLEAPTIGNDVKENILNGNAIDVEDLGTGNTVTANVRDRTLPCPRP